MSRPEPQIEDLAPGIDEFKYRTYQQYQDDLRAWDREQLKSEFQARLAKAESAKVRIRLVVDEILRLIRSVLLAVFVVVAGAGAIFLAGRLMGEKLGYTFDPEVITADGETYLSCNGANVSAEGTSGGDQTYKVTLPNPKRAP